MDISKYDERNWSNRVTWSIAKGMVDEGITVSLDGRSRGEVADELCKRMVDEFSLPVETANLVNFLQVVDYFVDGTTCLER